MKDSASKSAARIERRHGRHRKSLATSEGACAIVSDDDEEIVWDYENCAIVSDSDVDDDDEEIIWDLGNEAPAEISVLEESDIKDTKTPDFVIVDGTDEMVSHLSLGWSESTVKLLDKGIQVDVDVNREIRELVIILDN